MADRHAVPSDELDDWLGGFVVFGAMGLAMVGAAFCVACIVCGDSSFGESVQKSPLMLVWAVLIGTTGALSFAGLTAGARACTSGWKRITEKRHRRWLVGTICLLVILLSGMPIFAQQYPLDVRWPLGEHHSTRIAVITIAVLLPALTAIVGMWFTAVAAFDSLDKDKRNLKPQFEIALHLELSRRLQSLLWFVGIVIGCAVLSTGTLRRAMIEGPWAREHTFPQELVLAYGAYYTLLLIVSYLGPHMLMRRAGDRLVDYLADSDGTKRDKLAAIEWQQQRAKLAAMLNLGSSLQESLIGTLAILAPIVGGLLSLALPGK